MLNANTKARIALFNRAPQPDDKPDTVYPLMTGLIEANGANGFKKNVSAFEKVNQETGKRFLSLVIKNQNDEQTFTGTLFRDEKDGKEGHYYGYISEQFVSEDAKGKKEYSNSDWQLGISAKKHAPEGKKKYIGGELFPLNRNSSSATQVDEDDDVAF